MAVDTSMPILVVDDYNTMIRIIRNLLRQLGFSDVDDAPDGSAALSKMQYKRYGLVISDWNMEPMTGYELLKQVRSDPSISGTPFIMRPRTTAEPGIRNGGSTFSCSMKDFELCRTSMRTLSMISSPFRQVSIRNTMIKAMPNGNQPPSRSFVDADAKNTRSSARKLPLTM